jgi:biotin operon repressor
VQHIALATDNIIDTVSALQRQGVEFLRVPSSYYDKLLDRVGPIDEDLTELRNLGILVDRDDEGYMLQIFTRPVQDRPTLFYEVIQRKGSRSFGKGNFKALPGFCLQVAAASASPGAATRKTRASAGSASTPSKMATTQRPLWTPFRCPETFLKEQPKKPDRPSRVSNRAAPRLPALSG